MVFPVHKPRTRENWEQDPAISRRPVHRFSVKPLRGVKYQPKSMRYFNSCPWDKWWDEFLTSRGEGGHLTYPTYASFVAAKAKTSTESKVIAWAIGPLPVNSRARKNSLVPHLGNWQAIRAETFEYSDRKVQALQEIIKDRLDALEAGRGVADITLDMLADWKKLDQKINQLFEGVIDAQGGKLGDAQYKKVVHYLNMKERTRDGMILLLHSYLRCHGVGEDQLSILGQFAAASANAAIKGVVTGQMLTDPSAGASPIVRMMMDSFADKAKTFKMPLPQSIIDQEDPEVETSSKGGKG